MLNVILQNYEKSLDALDHDASFAKLMRMPVLERIGRLKYVPEEQAEAEYNDILKAINEQTAALTEGGNI
ncbi:MAG: V-type ATP synthase subunit A, partial [Clostridia bacterium]|nr:V-type ATP synthase subunit A [Clostridia bacterium]